jgi:hypothetical protein
VAREEDVRLRMPSDVLEVEAFRMTERQPDQALALRNLLVMEPAIPSAPVAKSAREEGSGTEGAVGTMAVAEN